MTLKHSQINWATINYCKHFTMPVTTRLSQQKKQNIALNKKGYNAVYGTFPDLLLEIESKFDEWVNSKDTTLSHNFIGLLKNHIHWVPVGKPLIAHTKQNTSTFQATQYMMYCSLHDLNDEEKQTRATESTYKHWLSIKPSSLPAENVGLGLFTAKTFYKEEVITVYIGERTTRDAKDLGKGKRIKFKSSTSNRNHFLDVQENNNSITTYMGAHFINDPMFGLVGDDRKRYVKTKQYRKTNAELQGLLVVATRRILLNEEILIDYGEEYYTDTGYYKDNNAKA